MPTTILLSRPDLKTQGHLCEDHSFIIQCFRDLLPKHLGTFNHYVDRILLFFAPTPPLHGQFLYPERGQKSTFFDPY